jgi:integrase
MRTRYQNGYIYRKGNIWLCRFYDNRVMPDGKVQRVQKAQKIVEYGGQYRSKAAVRPLVKEFLERINDSRVTPQSTMSLTQFVETRYLPMVKAHKRVSTAAGYRNLWNRYLKPHGEVSLRDFRTTDGERILGEIAEKHVLTITTLAHIKAFLSGVFRTATRLGVLYSSENPMRLVVLPKGKPAGETYAYSLEEITQMLSVLPWDAGTVVLTAAFTGVRKGELRGFLIDHYDGAAIRITHSYWRGHQLEPKTAKSKATVPIIAPLTKRLNRHLELMGGPETGLMFPGPAGKPLNLDAMARDVIRPALCRCFLCHRTEVGHADLAHSFTRDECLPRWHGWHAFRRGLATNLHRLGVPDKVIQAILRHANVDVTQRCYIKTADADVIAAMRLLEQSVENAPNMHLDGTFDVPIM